MPPGWPSCVALSRSEGEGTSLGRRGKGQMLPSLLTPHVVQSVYREPWTSVIQDKPQPPSSLWTWWPCFLRGQPWRMGETLWWQNLINSGVSSRCLLLPPCLGPRGFQGVGAAVCVPGWEAGGPSGPDYQAWSLVISSHFWEPGLAFCLGSKAVLLPWTPEVPCLRPEGKLKWRPGILRAGWGTGWKQLRSECPRRVAGNRTGNKEGSWRELSFPSLAPHHTSKAQPTLHQSPSWTKWSHLLSSCGLSLELRQGLHQKMVGPHRLTMHSKPHIGCNSMYLPSTCCFVKPQTQEKGPVATGCSQQTAVFARATLERGFPTSKSPSNIGAIRLTIRLPRWC